MPSRHLSCFVLSVALPLLTWACDNEFSKGWLVDRTRVLAARVEAAAEPSRASLMPGEHARVTWLVGAPNGTPSLAWSFATCPAPGGFLPELRCPNGAHKVGRGRADTEVVVMELDVPPAEIVADAQELLVLAAFCETGEPELDPVRFEGTCSGGGAALLASVNVRLAAAGPNANPRIADDDVSLDGVPTAPATARPSGPPCATNHESPIVVAGTEHTFGFTFRDDEREAVPDSPDGVETLLLSHTVTAGKLARQYSSLEPGETAPKHVTVSWTAPSRDEVGESGRLVELFFVLRDGRGGTAFTRRTVCVRRDP